MKQAIEQLCTKYDEATRAMLPTDKPLRLIGGESIFTKALASKCRKLGASYTFSEYYRQGYPTIIDTETSNDKIPDSGFAIKDDIDFVAHKGMPAVAEAVLEVLNAGGLPNNHIVIVGRGHSVKGLADKLLSEDATVTVCHSKTRYLYDATTVGDAIVLATPASARIAVCTLNKSLIIDLGGALDGRVILDGRYVGGASLGRLTTSILVHRAVAYANK